MLPEISEQDRVWYILKGYEISETTFYRVWYLNGERHREDGPAIEWADGDREWWVNGEFHREDGPAIEYADGHCVWYENDTFIRAGQI